MALEFVKTVVEIFFPLVDYLNGKLLPNEYGASDFLPKVVDQLKKLDGQKLAYGQDFPGSKLPPLSDKERCQWMKKIPKDRPIGQIIWPGTHHSATSEIGVPFITRPFSQRQTTSVHDQLFKGVRALDVRIQQDRFVCNGSRLSGTTIDHVIADIKTFLSDTDSEIIILEIQTERGYLDPENFEEYLVIQFGKLLIHQDEKVFSKSISEVHPGRIICVWKPIIKASKPKQGGPIWSGKYIKSDEIDVELPLSKFDGNINNLRSRSGSMALKTRSNFFYKVENTLNPRTCSSSSTLESLLVWTKHANVVSRRINGYARVFLAKCHKTGILHRLQIYSVDFVTEDFISACIGLNHQLVTWAKYTSVWRRPKSLKITHFGDVKSFKWVHRCWGRIFEVAYFPEVYSLNVSGDYTIDELQQGIKYEVLFWVEMLDPTFGWESDSMHVRLILPDGSIQENQVTITLAPRKSLYIPVGNFIKLPEMTAGQLKYSLEVKQVENVLKSGMIIYGVYIQPSFFAIATARDLSIKIHDAGECWRWVTVPSRYAKREIEVAELISARTLSVHGEFKTENLLVGCTYKVGFQILLSSTSTGWENPTKMTLMLPNGSSQERVGSFKDMPKDEDIYVHVGEFKMSSELVGKLEFSMINDIEVEKRGIHILLAFIV